ncbi:RagB/SusD family nutrient uptake outer membrane protein [Bacteroides heparinolyticus]|uniref:RagB/SusD family nutrient uptake outer membrane protein n=2 Tax=Prevotella heparinolytica TaxID=28113 RepID=UPI0023F372E7|nr:RagB/SusD family nutrient uptake outer membrane protein [Bacteroides heparinolyticus]
MKKYMKLLAAGCIIAALPACSDSFLEKEPNGYITLKQLQENSAWNPNIMLGLSAGVPATTFAHGTGGTTDHDDFGQKSIDIATDLMSGDMVMGGETYGWFSDDSKLTNSTRVRTRAYKLWRYYYQVIKAANSILDTTGDGKMPEEGSSNRLYYGQAKAMRAYAYFYLVNLYAKTYDVAKDDKAVPVYKSQLTAEAAPLSTVSEIYDFVIADLKEAITALTGMERAAKDTPDAAVAKGLLAYAYLQTGQYAEAAKIAKEVIDSKEYPLMSSKEVIESGFRSVDIPSFMWAIDLTKDNSPALPTFWGHVDYFTYSYCAAGDYKMIPDNLYAQIPATDVRKKWFRASAPQMNWYKFYDAGRKAMGDRLWTNDEVYMRVEEMYLITAEAAARGNNPDLAKSVLKELLAERDTEAAGKVDELSAKDLLESIYFNWRVEMWGEGRGLMTMKRFKKDVTRGSNDFAYPGETIKYDDPRLYFAIPEREIINNPMIK